MATFGRVSSQLTLCDMFGLLLLYSAGVPRCEDQQMVKHTKTRARIDTDKCSNAGSCQPAVRYDAGARVRRRQVMFDHRPKPTDAARRIETFIQSHVE
jgi:hypothetical protein